MAGGIVNGLFSGRAGIQSHGAAISVLADNISNANTTAFKQSRPDFTDILAGSIGGQGSSAVQIGSGSELKKVTQIFNQGTFEFTGRGLDLGIDGNGFFLVENEGTRYYSRAGNFSVDAEGTLRNQNGFSVLGFPANGSGGLQELNVNAVSQSSVETQNVTISGNLDASTGFTVQPTGVGTTFAQLSSAATFSTFVDVYDSLGDSHTVTMYFFHTAANTWTAAAYADGSEVSGGTTGLPSQLGANSTITFTSGGVRTTTPASDINVTNTWQSGATAADIDILFDPLTQFSSASNIQSITQDGSGTGSVISFNVEQNGNLFALLDNGQTTTIGTIALANFANSEGLQRVGGTLYLNSSASGEPVVGRPDTGQFGAIEAGALEISTADIAGDFVRLISLQRGFQGSARMITSINDLLQEIIQLAR